MLSRSQILEVKDLKTETVEVPEWGGEVLVRTMTGTERDSFEQSIITDGKADMKNIRAKLCVLAICDEQGKRIFKDSDLDDVGGKSALILDRIFNVAQRLNGISPDDVEELAKNSEEAQSESSTTD